MFSRFGLIKPDGTWIDVEQSGRHYATARRHGCARGPGIEGWISVTNALPGFEGRFTALFPARYTREQLATLKQYSLRFAIPLKQLLQHLPSPQPLENPFSRCQLL